MVSFFSDYFLWTCGEEIVSCNDISEMYAFVHMFLHTSNSIFNKIPVLLQIRADTEAPQSLRFHR